MEFEMIKCSRCNGAMPKLRLDKYGYDFCVNCSDVKPKVGRIRVIGEGDYTVTEMDVLDQDTAKRLQELENISRGVKNIPLEILNYDQDEVADDAKALESLIEKVIEDDLEVVIEDDEVEDEVEDIDEVELDDEEE